MAQKVSVQESSIAFFPNSEAIGVFSHSKGFGADSEQAPEEDTEQVPEKVPEEVPEQAREQAPGAGSGSRFRSRVLEKVLEEVPEQVPEEVPETVKLALSCWGCFLGLLYLFYIPTPLPMGLVGGASKM